MGLDLTVGWGFVCIGAELAKQLMSKAGMSVDEAVADAAVGVTGIKRRGPLHLAAANGKVEVCKFLIRSCEVDVDAADADGNSLLLLFILICVVLDRERCAVQSFSSARFLGCVLESVVEGEGLNSWSIN